jgi:hypothetical protein
VTTEQLLTVPILEIDTNVVTEQPPAVPISAV